MVFFSILFTSILKDFNLNLIEDHKLEFLWTILPMFVLIRIVIPSLDLLYYRETCLFCGLRIYVIGHQWYWRYRIKDFFYNELFFDSYMLSSDISDIRLLEVDNRLILPLETPVRVLCSSFDVIHSWTIPSLGVKIDAVPGRISQSCIVLNRTGVFFGQCSEICGINHSFMPIVLESISLKDFINLVLPCNLK